MRDQSCQFDQDLLSLYVSCNCDTEERMRVERHVRTCRRCRRELFELEAVWSALEEWQVDEAEAPFQPEALRAGLDARFGTPRGWAKWRERLASFWTWGVLKPIPVALVVGALAGLLAWWDGFTLPRINDSIGTRVVARATPSPESIERHATRISGQIDIEKALLELDRSAQNISPIERTAGVKTDGSLQDIYSALYRPSFPLPTSPPESRLIFVSAGRL